MNSIFKYSLILLASLFLVITSKFLESNYITDFLSKELLLVCIAIFTIHASSSAILISQLNMLSTSSKINFTATLNAVRRSFREEAIILFFIIVISIANESRVEYMAMEEVKMSLTLIQMLLISAQLFIIYDVLDAIIDSVKFSQPKIEG